MYLQQFILVTYLSNLLTKFRKPTWKIELFSYNLDIEINLET